VFVELILIDGVGELRFFEENMGEIIRRGARGGAYAGRTRPNNRYFKMVRHQAFARFQVASLPRSTNPTI
jgi:hypothetical protein